MYFHFNYSSVLVVHFYIFYLFIEVLPECIHSALKSSKQPYNYYFEILQVDCLTRLINSSSCFVLFSVSSLFFCLLTGFKGYLEGMALCRNFPWVDLMCLAVWTGWLPGECGLGHPSARAPRVCAGSLPSGCQLEAH